LLYPATHGVSRARRLMSWQSRYPSDILLCREAVAPVIIAGCTLGTAEVATAIASKKWVRRIITVRACDLPSVLLLCWLGVRKASALSFAETIYAHDLMQRLCPPFSSSHSVCFLQRWFSFFFHADGTASFAFVTRCLVIPWMEITGEFSCRNRNSTPWRTDGGV